MSLWYRGSETRVCLVYFRTLQALHAHGKKGIMHRDLHMGNILVKGGEAKLSDLGLSKICDSG